MKLVLEIRAPGDEHVRHAVLEKFPAVVGRGFSCDVILGDACVSAQHLKITGDAGAFAVTDLGSDNGLSVNGADRRGQSVPLKSGDVLTVGQTEIGVYLPDHAVPAAQLLQKAHPLFPWMARFGNVFACYLLALALTLGTTWLEVWTDEPGMALAAGGAVMTGIVAVWAAVWSVAGRLARQRAHYRSHAAMMCLYIIVGTLVWYAEIYVDFLTNENWISDTVAYGSNFILLAALLYGGLTLSTRLSPSWRRKAAGLFSFGVMAGVFIFGFVAAKNFNQQPLYPSTLKPYLAQLAQADTLEAFMAGNEKLFSSDEFEKQ